ncbi:helix-turn-helix domain-containing protein [Ureibacillus sp. NPDC094379]
MIKIFPYISNYNPLQPGFDKMTLNFRTPTFERFENNIQVLLFYEFIINDPSMEHVSVLPDACIEFLFELNPNKPSIYIGGSVLENRIIQFKRGVKYFGVRMLPEHGMRLIDTPVIDEVIPFITFEKYDHLLEQLISNNSFDNCINVFSTFIKLKAPSISKIPDFIPYTIQQSYINHGNIGINHLAEKAGYTVQYFRKKFEHYTGISPKLFNRIIRFQNSLNTLIYDNVSFVDVVDKFGYYDQSHLIREFRNFNYLTPSQIKKQHSNSL